MGGYGGMSLAEYDATPDWWLLNSYLADFDKDSKLIPLRRRQQWVETDDDGNEIEPAAEAGPAATPESLGIPLECFLVEGGERPGYVSWLLMYWTVWRRRGRSPEWITEHWRQDRAQQADYVARVDAARVRAGTGAGTGAGDGDKPRSDGQAQSQTRAGGGAPARLR